MARLSKRKQLILDEEPSLTQKLNYHIILSTASSQALSVAAVGPTQPLTPLFGAEQLISLYEIQCLMFCHL